MRLEWPPKMNNIFVLYCNVFFVLMYLSFSRPFFQQFDIFSLNSLPVF